MILRDSLLVNIYHSIKVKKTKCLRANKGIIYPKLNQESKTCQESKPSTTTQQTEGSLRRWDEKQLTWSPEIMKTRELRVLHLPLLQRWEPSLPPHVCEQQPISFSTAMLPHHLLDTAAVCRPRTAAKHAQPKALCLRGWSPAPRLAAPAQAMPAQAGFRGISQFPFPISLPGFL